jgi:hypothetical protein
VETDQIFNLCEGIMWVVIALVLAINAVKQRKYRLFSIWASVSFLLFGVSDFIEMKTGAWWEPWQFLLLKVICVASFFACLVSYRKRKTG